jgi:hypothetical protein
LIICDSRLKLSHEDPSNISPLGEINKIPTPPPLSHEDPSKNKAHRVISSKLIQEKPFTLETLSLTISRNEFSG